MLAFDDGGTEVPAQAVAGVVALVFLGVLAVVAPWPLLERSWPLMALGSLVGFAGWVALSTTWSSAVGDAVNDADRVAFYAAAFALAVVVFRAPALRRIAPDALLWGIVVVVLYALAGRLLPDLVDVEPSSFAGDRLSKPLPYWNAMGILAGFGVLLATAVASDERRAAAYRGVACAAAVPCALACYLTFSRASWAAVGVGLVVLLALRPRVSATIAGGLWLMAAGVLAGLLRAFPAALHLERGDAAQGSDGPPVMIAAILLSALVGFAFVRMQRGRPVVDSDISESTGLLDRRGRNWLRARGGLVAATAIGLVLAAGIGISFFGERTEQISKGADRVTSLKTYRGDYWRVALGSFAEHPVAGVGARGFPVEWMRERDSKVFAVDAHSLYFETLAELGLVGALLLSALFAAIVGGVRRFRRAAPDDPLLAAGAAVLGAFAVHAGLDWDWEVPTVTLVALLMAAALIQRPDTT